MAANTSSYMQQYHTQPGHCPAKIVMYWKIIPAYIRDSFGHFLMIYMYGFVCVCVCKIQTIYICIMYITRLRCQLNNQALSPPETDMAATSPGNPAKIRHLSSQCPIHIAQKLHYHHSHISSLLLHWFLAVWFDYTTNNYPEQSKGRRCSNMQFSKKMMRVSTQQGLEFSESPQRLAGHWGSDLQENEAKRRRQRNSCKEPVACDREGLNHKPSRFSLPRYGLDCPCPVYQPSISNIITDYFEIWEFCRSRLWTISRNIW